MKKIALIAALCFISFEGMSIGRPHNVFATYQAVYVQRVPVAKKSQPKPITQVANNAKTTVQKTQQVVFSVVRLLVQVIEGL